MERAEKVKKKLRSLEYPPLNPKDPWSLIDKLLNDLLKASEGYQFVKMKMRELKHELDNKASFHTKTKMRELEKDNDQLHLLLIERDKEIAMLNFQRKEGIQSLNLGSENDFHNQDIRSEPGMEYEKRLLEFEEFVKVANAYKTEILRLKVKYEGKSRVEQVSGERDGQRKKVLENQLEYLTGKNLQIEGELLREKEKVELILKRERRLETEKEELGNRLRSLEAKVEQGTEEIGQKMRKMEKEDQEIEEYQRKILRFEEELREMAKDIEDKNEMIERKENEVELARKELLIKGEVISRFENKLQEMKMTESERELNESQTHLQVRKLENEIEILRENMLTQENDGKIKENEMKNMSCLLYTSPSPRDLSTSRMPSSA